MADVKRKIVRNTVANTLLKLSSCIVGFLMSQVIVKYATRYAAKQGKPRILVLQSI